MLTQAVATIGVLFMLLTGCAPALLTYDGEDCDLYRYGEEEQLWADVMGRPFPKPGWEPELYGIATKQAGKLRSYAIKECFARYDMAAYRAERWGEGGGGGAGIPFVFVAPSAWYPYRP